MMFEFVESDNGARIKVIGIGGGGGNAINNMINANLLGVDFIAANTDSQALETSKAPTKLQLGANITKGLGAGANPEIGRSAALEDADRAYLLVAPLDAAHTVLAAVVRVEDIWRPLHPPPARGADDLLRPGG